MLIAGIEPATSSLPWMRSAYWAKSAYQKSILQIQIFVNIGLDLQEINWYYDKKSFKVDKP